MDEGAPRRRDRRRVDSRNSTRTTRARVFDGAPRRARFLRASDAFLDEADSDLLKSISCARSVGATCRGRGLRVEKADRAAFATSASSARRSPLTTQQHVRQAPRRMGEPAKQPHRARHEAGASRWRPPRLGSPVKTAPSLPRHHRRRSRRQIPSSSLTSSNPFPEPPGSRRRGHILQQGHPRRRLRRRIRDAQDHGGGGGVLDERHRERARGIRLQTRPGGPSLGIRTAREGARGGGEGVRRSRRRGAGKERARRTHPGDGRGDGDGDGGGDGTLPFARRRVRRGQARAPAGDGDGNRPRGYPRGRLPSRGR